MYRLEERSGILKLGIWLLCLWGLSISFLILVLICLFCILFICLWSIRLLLCIRLRKKEIRLRRRDGMSFLFGVSGVSRRMRRIV